MFNALMEKLNEFLDTPFGHAFEHAVTASATTAFGLLVTAYFSHAHQIHASDLSVAWASFASGMAFFFRTWIRNRAPRVKK